MNLYTSYFDNINNIVHKVPDMQFVCIAGYGPSDFNDTINLNFHFYKELAPKKHWWTTWHDKFIDNLKSQESIIYYTLMYNTTILQNLDVDKVYHELMYIKDNTECNNVCLLCYEKPYHFCHRKIVSEWFDINGYICKEF